MDRTFHTNILFGKQLQLFETLSTQSFINDFYLAGGIGLVGNYERTNEERNTINGNLDSVRISFFSYKYKIIDDFEIYNKLRLAGLRDIAAMKLEAIAGRGSKKDFVDLFFLLNLFKLEDIFTFHKIKYGPGLNNQYHHMKSLVYFADAEDEAMPAMIQPLDWSDVKEFIISKVKGYKF